MNKVDYIITGQGIAGSLLAWFLIQEGKKILVADPALDKTCTRVAAGLIHPLTGRRIVKSWNADLFIPFARNTYTSIEDKLGERFFEDYPVFEIFNDAGHRNDWAGRSAEPEMHNYISEECGAGEIPGGVKAPFGGRWVINGGWLDTRRFTDAIRRFLIQKASFIQEAMDYREVAFTDAGIVWKDIPATAIIDCSGSAAINHPLFQDLPFNPCKGELLQISSKDLPKDIVLHGPVKIIPLGGYEYLTGATYDFKTIDDNCTAEGKEKMEEALHKMTSAPYSITGHTAAVRPSTKDRRPIMGPHKNIKRLFVFNGLGSKGVMMGPYLAKQLSAFLLHNTPLDKEVNPYR